jgi:hypothetical protein
MIVGLLIAVLMLSNAVADTGDPAGPPQGGETHGFYFVECHGDILKWRRNRPKMKRLSLTMPDGSAAARAIKRSESRWSNVPGDRFRFIDATDNDNTITFGGDGNEVSYMLTDYLDGALAKTFWRTDSCGPLDSLTPGHNMLMWEADILFNEYEYDFDPAEPDAGALKPPSNAYYLRPVALHELGHALGLSIAGAPHENHSIANLNSNYPDGGWYPGWILLLPTGSVPAPRAMPHGDERQGVRFIYPGDEETEIDIAALNFAKQNATGPSAVLVAAPTPDHVCPGGTITVQYNFGNIGTEAVHFKLGFFLSVDDRITSSDIFLASESWYSGLGLGSYGPGIPTRTLTIPTTVPYGRKYHVGVFVDHDAQVTEAREYNNAVALPGILYTRLAAECP